MSRLDRRLNAYRSDLADERLRGQVNAERFVEPKRKKIATDVADILSAPSSSADLMAQALHGEEVQVFDEDDGFCWVQRCADNYVGYVASAALDEPGSAPTHVVSASRTFIYPEANLKLPIVEKLSMGSKVCVTNSAETRGTNYALLEGGRALFAAHLMPIGDIKSDFVSVAETLLHTPYLWGGNSGFGIDCSGLVQLAFGMCGKYVMRDTDMMMNSLGLLLETDAGFENLQRGDLVFWKGHIGIMSDAETLLHASAHTMNVAKEPLAKAVERIAYLYGKPLCVRRP